MSWLFFAISSYGLYGISNFIDKFLIEKKIRDASTVTIIGGFFSFVIGILLFAYKGFQLLPAFQIVILLISGILLTLYVVPYFKALALEDASRITPLFQFYPIFVLIVSNIALHERLTERQFLGFAFTLIGGFILGTKRIEKKLFVFRKSLWYMVLSSFLYAMSEIVFKYSKITDFWLSISYQTIGAGIGGFLLLLYTPYRNDFKKELGKLKRDVFMTISATQFVTLLADFSNFFAITLAPVTLVSVLQGVQPLFLLFYGSLLTLWFPHIIKEDIRKEIVGIKIFSAILLFIGLYFIYL